MPDTVGGLFRPTGRPLEQPAPGGQPAVTHPAHLDCESLKKVCTQKSFKASGPGGQHRNKIETGIMWTHIPTGITAQAAERREQHINSHMAFKRLRLNLALKHRTPFVQPQALWKTRVNHGRVTCSVDHDHYASLLADVLDAHEHFEGDLKKCAQIFDITVSQLVKFVGRSRLALAHLNQQRQSRGLHPLR